MDVHSSVVTTALFSRTRVVAVTVPAEPISVCLSVELPGNISTLALTLAAPLSDGVKRMPMRPAERWG